MWPTWVLWVLPWPKLRRTLLRNENNLAKEVNLVTSLSFLYWRGRKMFLRSPYSPQNCEAWGYDSMWQKATRVTDKLTLYEPATSSEGTNHEWWRSVRVRFGSVLKKKKRNSAEKFGRCLCLVSGFNPQYLRICSECTRISEYFVTTEHVIYPQSQVQIILWHLLITKRIDTVFVCQTHSMWSCLFYLPVHSRSCIGSLWIRLFSFQVVVF